jgi:hypothetical protein
MFVFIIPRVPVKMRNSLRDELWEISKKSLLNQTSQNWKAIIIGDTKSDELNNENFINLNYDEYTKSEKIEMALDYLKNNPTLNPEYLIRFDDDDIFSETILKYIEQLPKKYDCYFDEYHSYIDSVYLKISHKKNNWIANTAIHKYEHAITPCGKDNIQLLMQSHNEYWHIYYQNKNVFKTQKDNPLYFRNLTPFSLTSYNSNLKGKIDWGTHLKYLKGYGPWINLSKKYFFYYDLKKISNQFFKTKLYLSKFYWFFNWLKFIKKNIFFI